MYLDVTFFNNDSSGFVQLHLQLIEVDLAFKVKENHLCEFES